MKNPGEYLEEDSIPPSGFVEPSKIQFKQLVLDWDHWEARQRNGQQGLIFKNAPPEDLQPHGFPS